MDVYVIVQVLDTHDGTFKEIVKVRLNKEVAEEEARCLKEQSDRRVQRRDEMATIYRNLNFGYISRAEIARQHGWSEDNEEECAKISLVSSEFSNKNHQIFLEALEARGYKSEEWTDLSGERYDYVVEEHKVW